MNILITAPYGFIGSQIVSELLANNYKVIGCAKNTNYTKRIFPQIDVIYCDFTQDVSKEIWLPRLKNIDIVINCVGVLNANKKEMWRIHYEAPIALFEACTKTNVNKIIQISALGVETSQVLFAKTKKAADDYLSSLNISSIVIRPSLVYGSGSFGGTSFFRGLAGLPGVIPVPVALHTELQPIYGKDLARAVVNLIKNDSHERYRIINAVGSGNKSFFEIICAVRQWLGFGKAIEIKIPLFILKFSTKIGDWFKLTLNSTLFQMSLFNNVATKEEAQRFAEALGYQPKTLEEGLAQQPSFVQDRWHARLYFLRPLLKLSLGFVWIYSGVVSLFGYPRQLSYALLTQVGITQQQELVLVAASILDIMLGLATLFGRRMAIVGSLQVLLIMGYTLLISFTMPGFWLHPFAPIVKNIPLIVATLIMIAMESKR